VYGGRLRLSVRANLRWIREGTNGENEHGVSFSKGLGGGNDPSIIVLAIGSDSDEHSCRKRKTCRLAARCGFADADVLRRAFLRRVGVTPAEYRRRHGMLAR
jgi:AraC-like DNA-binding protein